MENENKKHIEALQRLVSICNDSKDSYLNAAEHTETDYFRQTFWAIAKKRQAFAQELKEHILQLGGDADNEHGNFLGTINTFWSDLKNTVSKHSKDDKGILTACRSADRSVLETYDDILQGSILYTDLKPVITNQRTEIHEDFRVIDRMHEEQFSQGDKEL